MMKVKALRLNNLLSSLRNNVERLKKSKLLLDFFLITLAILELMSSRTYKFLRALLERFRIGC